MKNKIIVVMLIAMLVMATYATAFAEDSENMTEPIGTTTEIMEPQAITPFAVGQTIAETFPDPNLAQAVADAKASGDVNAILDQTMIDSLILLNANYENISDLTGIETLTGLEYLHVGGNNLTTIPDSISGLVNLKQLSLGFNSLTTLPDSIGDLPALESLLLYGNQLTTLPDSIGNLSTLEELWAYDNHLITLPDSIGNLSALQHLSLHHNQLTSLPNTIGNLSALTQLDIWFNLLPSTYADTLNTLGLNFTVTQDIQSSMELRSGLSPYIIQNGSDFNALGLHAMAQVNSGGTLTNLVPEQNLILENYVDENGDPISIDTYLKNGVVQKTGTVFAQIRATGTGLFPNNSDNAITAEQIELQFEATEYELSFNLNGGSGTVPPSQMLAEGATGIAVDNPIRGGYVFKGWNTAADGSGTNWILGTTPMLNQAVTLYAQWEVATGPVDPTNPNTPAGNGSTKTTPKTGDDTNLLGFGILLLGASTGLILMRRKFTNNESLKN